MYQRSRRVVKLAGAAALAAAAVLASLAAEPAPPDNRLTPQEAKEGWILLFDGKTLDGWKTSDGKPSRRPVEDGQLNPCRSGHYMLVHEKEWGDFVLRLDFRIAPRTNSGVFFRVSSLTPLPGKDVGYNGLEAAIDDTPGAGFHDTGAIYDLARPSRNAMKKAGEWNTLVLTCRGSRIAVEINGETVTRMELDEWKEKGRRPDGSMHKFETAWRDHPRRGLIGLQDHGGDVWFKNLKLLPLEKG